MFLKEYADALIAFVREHRNFAEPIVFVVGMAESIPLFSVFVPSSVLFLGIGAAHGITGSPFTHLWLAGALGATAGDCISYALGRTFEHRVVHWWPLSRHPEWWDKGNSFFERRGVLGVAAGKFMGPFRPVVPIIAGVMEMPFLLFVAGSLVSSLAWAAVFLAPGMFGLKWLAP